MKNSEYMLVRSGNLNCSLHINPELEFVCVTKGSVKVFYDTETVEVSCGEAAIVLPFSVHGFEMSPDTDGKVFMFSQSVFEAYRDSVSKSVKEGKYKLSKDAFNFADYVSLKAELSLADTRAAFYALICEVSTSGQIQHKTSDDHKRVMEYIYKNISEPLNLDSISSRLGIGKKRISNILKSSHGVGITAFINNVRLERAKILLVSTDKTVTEIAYECGFGSVRTFNRIFAGKTGRTPGEYRKTI